MMSMLSSPTCHKRRRADDIQNQPSTALIPSTSPSTSPSSTTEITLRSEIARLQTLLEYEKQQVQMITEQQKTNEEKWKQQLSTATSRSDSLSVKLRFLYDEESKQRIQRQQLQSQISIQQNEIRQQSEQIIHLQQQVESLQQQITGMKSISMRKKDDSSTLAPRASPNPELDNLTSSALDTSLSPHDNTPTIQQLQHQLQQQSTSYQSQIDTLQQQLIEVRMERDHAVANNAVADVDVNQIRQHATQHIQLERAHRQAIQQLKQAQTQLNSLSMVHEQLLTAQSRLERAATLETEVATLRADRDMLQSQLTTWITTLQPICDTGMHITPETVSQYIHTRVASLLLAESRTRAFELHVKTVEQRLLEAQQQLEQAKQNDIQHSKNIQQQQQIIVQNQQMIQQLIQERSGLRRLLDSYDQEDTNTSHDTSRIQRIQELEIQNEKLLQQLQHIQQSLPSTSSIISPAEYQEQVTALQQQQRAYRELQLEHGKLQQQIQALATQHAEIQAKLQSQISSQTQTTGDENGVPGTKVLHVADGPQKAAIATRQQQLLAENQSLQSKLIALQAQLAQHNNTSSNDTNTSTSTSTSTSNITDTSVYCLKCETYRNELQSCEKRVTRLKEAFATRVREFRESTYQLTGYKIEMKDGRLKLRSMYAAHEDDYLLFQYQPNSSIIECCHTDVIDRLPRHLTHYLHQYNSIPAFTAAVTLDAFDKTTKA